MRPPVTRPPAPTANWCYITITICLVGQWSANTFFFWGLIMSTWINDFDYKRRRNNLLDLDLRSEDLWRGYPYSKTLLDLQSEDLSGVRNQPPIFFYAMLSSMILEIRTRATSLLLWRIPLKIFTDDYQGDSNNMIKIIVQLNTSNAILSVWLASSRTHLTMTNTSESTPYLYLKRGVFDSRITNQISRFH